MFIIISQLIIQKIINKDFNFKDLKIFSFAVLSYSNQTFSMYIGLLVIYYLFKFHKININPRIITEIRTPIVLSILWLIKNFILFDFFCFH